MDRAVHDFVVGNDAAEGIEDRVEDECLERRVLVAHGSRYAFDHGAENVLHAFARAARGADNLAAVAAQQVDDFVLHLFGHRVHHVAFAEHGNDFEIVFDGHVEVRDSLSLHALRRVHEEQAALTGRDAARNLVGEVHVSRRVDEVQAVGFAFVHVFHLYGVALDGDAPFAFQVHIIEHLPLRHLDGVGKFEQSVGQGTFAVVNVGDDAEVAYMLHGVEIL